jgi:transcriptional regulator with GAF, ATPase, and Fis domain
MSRQNLELTYNSADGRKYKAALSGRMLIIGSSPDCDLVLDSKAPEAAARIQPVSDGYILTSVAVGKLRVNGKKVKTHILEPGDVISAGESEIICDITKNTELPPSVAAQEIVKSFSRFSEAVGRERDLKKLLVGIMNILIELLGGTDAFIFILDSSGKIQEFVSTGGNDSAEKRFSDTIVRKVLSEGRGICVHNDFNNHEYSLSKSIVNFQISSILCCPITITGRTCGIIYLGSSSLSHSYSQNDLSVLEMYAILAGMLINHVEFISQQQNSIQRLTRHNAFDGVIGESLAMKKIFGIISSLEHSDIPVLLEGETGTGKDVMAQLIHKQSKRASKPLIAVNCSSLKGELLESELFGHVKGAFTGAVKDHGGLCLAANGGTLFLDEIGEMDVSLQAKMLRMLENGKIRAVGSSAEKDVDVRLICATNRNLKDMVETRQFRQDLFFRINQFRILLPPVRERGEDVVLLAYYFLEKFKSEYAYKTITDFHASSLRTISSYDWPGNVREIANAVHKAVLMSSGPLVEMDIPDTGNKGPASFEAATSEFQRGFLQKAIKACNGNKEETAKMLGMSRSTFFRYLASLGI